MFFQQKVKQLFLLTNNSIIGSGASYFLTIYLANNFGPEKFGLYSYILTISSFCTLFINWASDQSAASFISKGVSIASLFSTVFCVRVFFFLLSIIGVFAVDDMTLQKLVAILFINLSGFNLSYHFEISGKNKIYSFIYLAERLLYVIVVLLLFYFGFKKMTYVISTYFIILILSLFTQYILFERSYILNVSFPNVKVLLTFIKGNISLVLIMLSAFVYGGISRLFIEKKLGLEALGIFSSGMQLTVLATIFQAQVERVWRSPIYEAISEFNLEKIKNNVKPYLFFTTLPLLIGSVILVFCSDFLVQIIFTDEYKEVASIFPYISFFFITININSLLTILFFGYNKSNEFLLYSALSSITLLIIFFLLPSSASLVTFILSIFICQLLSLMYSSIRIFYIMKKMQGRVLASG